MNTNPPLVLIEWEDSHFRHGWQRGVEDGQITPVICHSAGWLIHDGKEAKVIAGTISRGEENPQTNGDMTIPARAIRRIKKLR